MVVDASALIVRRIASGDALAALAGLEAVDPSGLSTPESMAATVAAGECFEVLSIDGRAVYCLEVVAGCVWVHFARACGSVDWAAVLDEIIRQQAQGMTVRFQTARAGLVKRAKRRGFVVKGWILEARREA